MGWHKWDIHQPGSSRVAWPSELTMCVQPGSLANWSTDRFQVELSQEFFELGTTSRACFLRLSATNKA
jgi:hypothetical protein